MAYLLRTLISLMLLGIGITTLTALGKLELSLSHIQIAIPAFIYLIFAQAFVMFYFIGVSRLITNIWNVLHSEGNLAELFDEPPKDLGPYVKKVRKYVFDSTLAKRQTIPWTMMMLVLGTIGFLLGGAHDTGMVRKIIHSGVIYGFIAAMLIGFFKQWSYLGKTHRLLREVKILFSMSDNSM
jgi:hypothetical protein